MNSFIGWIGGKKLLRNEITKRFPEGIGRYIEVFGGAGWVLFSKERHAELEVFNDANGDLINLFRCIKYHCFELQRELQYMLNSRELFEDFKAQYNIRGMTDIQRAARFFMLIKTSYGSDTRTYGCVKKNVSVIIKYIEDIQKRLNNVVIENRDFERLIKVYDRPDALLFLDPPYYGTERYYQVDFPVNDHQRLYDSLKKIKGKFILTYNDCEEIKELYKDFAIEEVSRNNNLVGRYSEKNHSYRELIIRNY
jgi:DNA adenine methylase